MGALLIFAVDLQAFMIPAAAGGDLDTTTLAGTFDEAAAMHVAAIHILFPQQGASDPGCDADVKAFLLAAITKCKEYVQHNGTKVCGPAAPRCI